RALISVSNKQSLLPFAKSLVARGVEIVSSGGTSSAIAGAGLPVTKVADVTNAPEILGGRVKTLHPKIHGGILGRPGLASDDADMEAQGITPFGLVVVNL
ncbi:MAG TPA: bifunctional phosphoribosylaminoimidazolecarboxamide formyltransferase/inosine monophosphate cyclohydrolase, partial [Alphaproteobacteria bacterium]|nr:bifunctional phosphoribosylaminoimidazolecarboxamide formyltransferase/inosine monophosphate cyclohydrolase [Alphaproteobacteria bacterium]